MTSSWKEMLPVNSCMKTSHALPLLSCKAAVEEAICMGETGAEGMFHSSQAC